MVNYTHFPRDQTVILGKQNEAEGTPTIAVLAEHCNPTNAATKSRGPISSRPIPQAQTQQGNPLDYKKSQLLTGGVAGGDNLKSVELHPGCGWGANENWSQ